MCVLFYFSAASVVYKGPARTLNRASVWDLYELQWTVFFFRERKGVNVAPVGSVARFKHSEQTVLFSVAVIVVVRRARNRTPYMA